MNEQSKEKAVKIDSDQVAQYLLDNPEFFLKHEEVLAALTIHDLRRDGTISLMQKQNEVLKERYKVIENNFRDTMANVVGNQEQWLKLQALNLFLLEHKKTQALEPFLEQVSGYIKTEYELSHVAIKLPSHMLDDNGDEYSFSDDIIPTELIQKLALGNSICGVKLAQEQIDQLFNQALPVAHSLAMLRITIDQQVVGVMAFASDKPERFNESMNTIYLNCMSDLISKAIV